MDGPTPICFRCGSPLNLTFEDHAACGGCGERYPKVMQIADLRKDRLPESDFDAVILKKMLAVFPSATFLDLLEIWMADQTISREVIDTATRYYQTQHARGSQMVEMFARRAAEKFPLPTDTCALDLGCGVGASFAYLSARYRQVIAVDLSLISLLLAQKYIQEQGFENITLIRAQGDALPFADGTFPFITALNVLEHIFIVDRIAAEVHRVLADGGIFTADSRNRFDLFLPEPHTHIRWLGFLPRGLGKRFAHWRSNNDYDDVYLLSYFQLRNAFWRVFGNGAIIGFPDVSAYGYSGRIDRVVQAVESIPLLRELALTVFPSHLVLASKQ